MTWINKAQRQPYSYKSDTTIIDKKIETEERAKEIVDKLEKFGYLKRLTLIKKRVFTLYDYSAHNGIRLIDFLNE